jgi:hypothetical protein
LRCAIARWCTHNAPLPIGASIAEIKNLSANDAVSLFPLRRLEIIERADARKIRFAGSSQNAATSHQRVAHTVFGAQMKYLHRFDLVQFARLIDGLTVNCDHEQRITPHLNLSSAQCKYHHRMRVRGDFRTLAGVLSAFAGIWNEPMAAWVLRLIGVPDGTPIDSAGVRNNDAWKDADDDSWQ